MGYQPAVTDLIRTSDELYLDFARDDLGHPDQPDLASQLYEELHHRCHQANPPLVCRTYRHPMYLRRDGGQLAARHINQAHEQLNHGKSPEHEACKERILQMADQRGLEAHEESSRGADERTHSGRISDVVLHGETTIGFEAAYTDSTLAVTRKFNRGARDGITVYFGGPRERTASSNFIDRVPYGTYNDIPALEIRRGRPMPIISGLRRLRRWRCASEPTSCPHFGKLALCTQTWHSDYLDPEGQVDQDDVVYYLATGTWVPVRLPTKQGSTWQIVPAESVEIFLDDGGTLLDTKPSVPTKKPKSTTAAIAANPDCTYAITVVSPGSTIAPARYRTPIVTAEDLRRCAYTECRAVDGIRLYACGPRCPRHTPAALAGELEPDQLLANRSAQVLDGWTTPPGPNSFPYPPGQGGPCARCTTRHHRYGSGGEPLCPRCRP